MVENIRDLLIRDLGRLSNEISLFAKEEELWVTLGDIQNSAGNLCLHLIGNLNEYVGRQLGSTVYKRDRIFEFAGKDVPKAELLAGITETQKMITMVLSKLSADDLTKVYPENVLGNEITTGLFLLHLYGHLTYHMGQINYLRRALSN